MPTLAALKEGFNHLSVFSLWQLPEKKAEELTSMSTARKKAISLHFANERIKVSANYETFEDIEILIKSNKVIISKEIDYKSHIDCLSKLVHEKDKMANN